MVWIFVLLFQKLCRRCVRLEDWWHLEVGGHRFHDLVQERLQSGLLRRVHEVPKAVHRMRPDTNIVKHFLYSQNINFDLQLETTMLDELANKWHYMILLVQSGQDKTYQVSLIANYFLLSRPLQDAFVPILNPWIEQAGRILYNQSDQKKIAKCL